MAWFIADRGKVIHVLSVCILKSTEREFIEISILFLFLVMK